MSRISEGARSGLYATEPWTWSFNSRRRWIWSRSTKLEEKRFLQSYVWFCGTCWPHLTPELVGSHFIFHSGFSFLRAMKGMGLRAQERYLPQFPANGWVLCAFLFHNYMASAWHKSAYVCFRLSMAYPIRPVSVNHIQKHVACRAVPFRLFWRISWKHCVEIWLNPRMVFAIELPEGILMFNVDKMFSIAIFLSLRITDLALFSESSLFEVGWNPRNCKLVNIRLNISSLRDIPYSNSLLRCWGQTRVRTS